MKALSLYQQAILTEMGITQWQLREPLPEVDAISDEQSQATEATQVSDPQPTLMPDDKIVEPDHSLIEKQVTTAPQQDVAFIDLSGKLLLNFKADAGKRPVVQDVLLALGLTPELAVFVSEDVQRYQGQTFSWLIQDSEEVSLDSHTLITPELDKLAHSPELKQTLWQQMSQMLATNEKS